MATDTPARVWIQAPVDAKAGDVLRLPSGRVYVLSAGEAGASIPADAFWVPPAGWMAE